MPELYSPIYVGHIKMNKHLFVPTRKLLIVEKLLLSHIHGDKSTRTNICFFLPQEKCT